MSMDIKPDDLPKFPPGNWELVNKENFPDHIIPAGSFFCPPREGNWIAASECVGSSLKDMYSIWWLFPKEESVSPFKSPSEEAREIINKRNQNIDMEENEKPNPIIVDQLRKEGAYIEAQISEKERAIDKASCLMKEIAGNPSASVNLGGEEIFNDIAHSSLQQSIDRWRDQIVVLKTEFEKLFDKAKQEEEPEKEKPEEQKMPHIFYDPRRLCEGPDSRPFIIDLQGKRYDGLDWHAFTLEELIALRANLNAFLDSHLSQNKEENDMTTLREVSRGFFNQSECPSSWNDIQTGCLQRIADATELMAKDYRDLQRQRDHWESMYDQKRESCERMARRISALKGVITRMKTQQLNNR